jgi:predicted porin
MQKKLLTVAVAGVLAAPAAAMADVTVYGTIDTGIRQQSKVVTATGDDSLLTVTDGMRTTNRWGLRGSEDLGGGLRANFTLEGQYASDTGGGPGPSTAGQQTTTGAPQGLFQRKAVVGLSGGAWSVDLGRDYMVNFKSQGIYDPMSYTYTGFTPSAGNNVSGTRWSNGVTAGFRFGTGGIRVDYALGEVVGESDAFMGIMADFAFGPITVTGAWGTRDVTAPAPVGTVTQETLNLGGAWKIGAFTIRAGYSTSEYSTDAVSDVGDTPMILAGVQWSVSPTIDLRLGYYSMDFNVAGTEVGSRDWFIVAMDYVLSKNTRLYVAVDRAGMENSSITVNGNTGVVTIGANGQGSNMGVNSMDGSTGFSAGIAHTF